MRFPRCDSIIKMRKAGRKMGLKNMNRTELLCYLRDMVEAMEQSNLLLQEEEIEFIAVQKMVIRELEHNRIYKVCTRCPKPGTNMASEYEPQYFSSLQAARKEFRKRTKELFRNPDPSFELTDIETNTHQHILHQGRYKFFRALVSRDGFSIMMEVVLSEVCPAPLERPAVIPHSAPRGEIILFDEIAAMQPSL